MPFNIKKLQLDLAKTKDPIEKAVLTVFLKYIIKFQQQQLDINRIIREQDTSIATLKRISKSKKMKAYNELLDENAKNPINTNDKILDRLNLEIDMQIQQC